MEDLQAKILSGFGLKAKKIIKEKNGYACETQKGLVIMQKTNESREHIIFSHSVKEYLHNAGFSQTDRYLLSTKDKPYALLENDIYVATLGYNRQKMNFENSEDFIKALRQVARMHKLSGDMSVPSTFYQELNLPDTFSKKLGELHSIKKRIGIKKRLSDFDVLVLKNYSYYEKQIQDALSYIDNKGAKFTGGCLCHNELKEDFLPVVEQQVHITNFSRCCFMDTPLTDISGMINRYIKNLPESHIPIRDVLDVYLSINPLSAMEIRMLYSHLLYPEKFLKLCSYYYSKKRTWIPNAMINRMETLVHDRERTLQYVEALKP